MAKKKSELVQASEPEPDREILRKSPSPSCGRCVGTGLVHDGIGTSPCECTVRRGGGS